MEDNIALLKRNAKWEYQCLGRDLEAQGDKWNYKGGFKAWFKEVFMIDEAWAEIREQIIINK